MELSEILTPERVFCGVEATSKKRALEILSGALACDELSNDQVAIFDCLIARERLGSTGFGGGVAIPHARVKNANFTVASFVRLAEPIDYDALDGKRVDMLFALVVPEESTDEHLQVLAKLAEMFGNEGFCSQLRESDDAERLHQLITHWHAES